MATKKIKVLSIHGLGDHRDGTWMPTWEKAIQNAFSITGDIEIECDFVNYDDIFEDTNLTPFQLAGAVWKLGKSGLGSFGRRQRGILGDISKKVQWTAGYVVAWVENDHFQKKTRKRLLDAILKHKPDVIVAHSLGSLIAYNAFSHPDALSNGQLKRQLKKIDFVTIGSQIGNRFVVGNLTPGRLDPLPVRYWHHLYNRHDSVFTKPISIPTAKNFEQVETHFDIDGFADHAAPNYIQHGSAIEQVWRPISVGHLDTRTLNSRATRTFGAIRAKRRALLIGINNYPNEQDRLEGCVNDVFEMSAILQECGFAPADIRTCMDERATTEGILERMEWLLDAPQSGDERVFYFSGHGARIPAYGEEFEPDRHLETLVPWDFDWTREKAITDDQIYQLYSQLPYDLRFAMIFDCCHSGDMHRSGSAKAKGMTPPDDIRHRELKWSHEEQMWVSREFQRQDKGFSRSSTVKADYFGENGATERLGRASMLRTLTDSQYKKVKKAMGHDIIGPYLPLIIQACAEHEYAYEYRHGVTSHGAFTYCLTSMLRREMEQGREITFEELVTKAKERLKNLEYDQEPQILGPSSIRLAPIPWL